MNDKKAIKYFERLAARARTRSALFARQATAAVNATTKAQLIEQSEQQAAYATDLQRRADGLSAEVRARAQNKPNTDENK